MALIDEQLLVEHLDLAHGDWVHGSEIPWLIRQWRKVAAPLNTVATPWTLPSLQQSVASNSRFEWIGACWLLQTALPCLPTVGEIVRSK